MSGGGDLARQAIELMQLMNQQAAQANAKAQSQLAANLEIAQPGETFGQLGLSPRVLKRALGRVPKSTELVKDLTAKDVLDQKVQAYLASAPPDEIDALAATKAATEAGAPTGLYTGKGIATGAKANEVQATTALETAKGVQKSQIAGAIAQSQAQASQNQTLADAVDAGRKAWTGLSSDTQKAIGFKTLFGTTAEQFQNGEVSAALDTAMKREALKATADPNHPLNKFFRQSGIDPAAGIGALGMGAGQLLAQYMERVTRFTVANVERETALEKGNVDAATDVAKKFGVSTSEVLKQWDMINSGKTPTTTFGKALQQGILMNIQAGVVDAATKGDPDAQRLAKVLDVVPKLANDPTALKQYDAAARTQEAKLLIKLQGIPTPAPTDAKGTELYNEAVSQMSTMLSSFGTDAILGIFGKSIQFNQPPAVQGAGAQDATAAPGLINPAPPTAPGAAPAVPGAGSAGGLTPQQQAAAKQLFDVLGLSPTGQPTVPSPQP